MEAFLAPPSIQFLQLSPDGQKLALVTSHDFHEIAVIIDLATMRPEPAVTFDDATPIRMWWKGNNHLLFLVRDFHHNAFFRSFDLQTRKVNFLFAFNSRRARVVDPLRADPAHMIVSMGTKTGFDLRRLNVITGKSTVLEENPGYIHRWLVNRNSEAVAGFGLLGEEWFMLSRPALGSPWHKTSLGGGRLPDFMPAAVHDDQRRILGVDFTTSDTARVVVRDPTTGADDLVFHSPETDSFNLLAWGDDPNRVRVIAYEADRLRYQYLDKDERLVAEIDAALPGTINDLLSASADESRLLIASRQEHEPMRYWLLDRSARKLTPLGSGQAGVKNSDLTPGKRFSFLNRDGIRLTGVIHIPRDRPLPLPAVVYTRRGINVRSDTGFNPYIQLITSRGFAVVQVNQRGVDGFGRSFAAAGEAALDTLMADDIADGVAHAGAEGWIDPAKVAIYGRDLGGILAVYALTRNEARFAAWVNVNTPMNRGAFRPEDLALDHAEQSARWLGVTQESKLRAYSWNLDPAALLSRVKVPSFHFYDSVFLVEREGGKVERTLKQSGAPFEFEKGLPPKDKGTSVEMIARKRHQEEVRAFGGIMEFLERHLE